MTKDVTTHYDFQTQMQKSKSGGQAPKAEDPLHSQKAFGCSQFPGQGEDGTSYFQIITAPAPDPSRPLGSLARVVCYILGPTVTLKA